jgi:hypothetical protein
MIIIGICYMIAPFAAEPGIEMMWSRYLPLVCGWFAAGPAMAQDFACPKAGAQEHQGVYTWSYATSSDPHICNAVDSWGKPKARIFNFYFNIFADYTRDEKAQLLAQMESLISRRQSSVTITFDTKAVHVWTFVRDETILIDGKPIETMVVTQQTKKAPNAQVPLAVTVTRWLDIKHGMWVKAHLDHLEGATAFTGPWLNSYEDDHISYGS